MTDTPGKPAKLRLGTRNSPLAMAQAVDGNRWGHPKVGQSLQDFDLFNITAVVDPTS